MPHVEFSTMRSLVGRLPRYFMTLSWREYRVGLAFVACGATLAAGWAFVTRPNDLCEVDFARLCEFHNLRRVVGEQIWPGWGQVQTPVLLVKPGVDYLINHPTPPAGFREVFHPARAHRVFRRSGHLIPQPAMCALPIQGTPTVIVPDKRTAEQLGNLVAPGEVIVRGFEGGDDTAAYLIVLMHEGFHAYQETAGMDRLLERLDLAGGEWPDPEPTSLGPSTADEARWTRLARLNDRVIKELLADAESRRHIAELLEKECRQLAAALAAASEQSCRHEAGKFLAARQARRQATAVASTSLTARQIANLEQALEWVEGMARYTELRLCVTLQSGEYTPVPELAADSEFQGYGRLCVVDDIPLAETHRQPFRTRAYVVGAALCQLLDRLSPGWKDEALHEGRPLEQLVADVITP